MDFRYICGVAITNTKTMDLIHIKEGSIDISFRSFLKEQEGIITVTIPAYNITFCAPNREEANKRGVALVLAFYESWLKIDGWKSFLFKIHSLGFRGKKHDHVMSQLLRQRPTTAKMSNNLKVVPEGVSETLSTSYAA